jgi:hypothetical protein
MKSLLVARCIHTASILYVCTTGRTHSVLIKVVATTQLSRTDYSSVVCMDAREDCACKIELVSDSTRQYIPVGETLLPARQVPYRKCAVHSKERNDDQSLTT